MLMSSTESNWKSKLKSVFNNGYLAFGFGIIVGLTIDNWLLVLIIALVVWGVQWYAKGKEEDELEQTA